jgi:hypothetical protein
MNFREILCFVTVAGSVLSSSALFAAEDEPPQLYSPATPVLTPEELTQYNARMLALDNIDDACSKTYNTIVLPDPESDNWLVWAIAATTEPGVMVVGGHYRFTVAEDGSEILRTDRFFTGCLNLSSPDVPRGAQSFHSVGHVISLTPLETHVFTSLGWPDQFYVGTNDGKAWRLDKGRITSVDVTSDGADGASARFLLGTTERCSAIARDTTQSEERYVRTEPTLKLILPMENSDEVPFNAGDGFELTGFICGRFDIVPLPNDYKFLRSGASLYVMDLGEGHPERMITYKFENGAFTAEVATGEAVDAELQARIDERSAQFREAMAAAP